MATSLITRTFSFVGIATYLLRAITRHESDRSHGLDAPQVRRGR